MIFARPINFKPSPNEPKMQTVNHNRIPQPLHPVDLLNGPIIHRWAYLCHNDLQIDKSDFFAALANDADVSISVSTVKVHNT